MKRDHDLNHMPVLRTSSPSLVLVFLQTCRTYGALSDSGFRPCAIDTAGLFRASYIPCLMVIPEARGASMPVPHPSAD